MELDTEVTPALVREKNPDVVVLATGSKEVIPDLPGMKEDQVITLDQFLLGEKKAGKRVAVLGGHYGAKAAVTLSREGKSKPEGYTKYHKAMGERLLAVDDPAKVREVHLLEEGPMVGFPPYGQMLRFMVLNEYLIEGGVDVKTGV
ncbi:MAG: FAD-dependent oxidoreductase, partial [Thermodesulfobacteriota bacterium]